MRYTSPSRRQPARARQSPTPRRSVRPVARNRAHAEIVRRTLDCRNRFLREVPPVVSIRWTRMVPKIPLIPLQNFHRRVVPGNPAHSPAA